MDASDVIPTKECRVCGEVKPEPEFCKGRRRCKICEREKSRRWYAENRERALDRRRQYVAVNRDEINEAKRQSYQANREIVLERKRERYWANPEAFRDATRRWYAENPEPVRERERQRYYENREERNAAARRWYEENRERAAEYNRRYQQGNPEVIRRATHKRRTRLRDLPPLTTDDIGYIDVLYCDPCAYCGAPATAIDHIQATANSGAGDWMNLTASCSICNSRKRTISLLQFLLRSTPTPGV